jgi:hypothetical protein
VVLSKGYTKAYGFRGDGSITYKTQNAETYFSSLKITYEKHQDFIELYISTTEPLTAPEWQSLGYINVTLSNVKYIKAVSSIGTIDLVILPSGLIQTVSAITNCEINYCVPFAI